MVNVGQLQYNRQSISLRRNIHVLSVALNNDLAREYCGRSIDPSDRFRPWAWQDTFCVLHTLSAGGIFRPGRDAVSSSPPVPTALDPQRSESSAPED